MDMTSSLSELRAVIERARAMPMSASAVINRAEVLRLLDRVEQTLPEALAESARVVSRRDAVVADAQTRGERILDEARNERDRLVSDTEVYRNARREAETLRASVRRECDELERATDEYVDTQLARLEITLTKTLEAVTRGRGRLQDRWDPDAESLEPADPPARSSTGRRGRSLPEPATDPQVPDRAPAKPDRRHPLPDGPRTASPLRRR